MQDELNAIGTKAVGQMLEAFLLLVVVDMIMLGLWEICWWLGLCVWELCFVTVKKKTSYATWKRIEGAKENYQSYKLMIGMCCVVISNEPLLPSHIKHKRWEYPVKNQGVCARIKIYYFPPISRLYCHVRNSDIIYARFLFGLTN